MTEHVPFFDWINYHLGAVVTFLLGIWSGLLALAYGFNSMIEKKLSKVTVDLDNDMIDVRTEVDEELKRYRHDMKNWGLIVTAQGAAIITLQSEQRHTVMELSDIKISTRDINTKLEVMTKDIASVLFAVRRGA